METFSKGVHRALVPLESAAENVVAAELVEAAPGYRMVTQMDVARFLARAPPSWGRHPVALRARRRRRRRRARRGERHQGDRGRPGDARRVARRRPRRGRRPADDADARRILLQLQDGRGKRVVETFSATDLRDCPVAELQAWLGVAVAEFKKKVAMYRAGVLAADADEEEERRREMVTCSPESTLGEAIEKAVAHHVHRLWVVDEEGLLAGVVSLTDVLRVVREAAIGEDRELHDILS